jgi:hypothetical protein
VLLPPPTFASAFRVSRLAVKQGFGSEFSATRPIGKGVYVQLARTEESQEAQVLVSARLVDAEEDQVVPQSFLGGRGTENPAPGSEQLYGVFGVVVVPGNTVVTQEYGKRPIRP